MANALFEEFWQWRVDRSPEFATLAGCKEHNHRLETFTEQRFKEDKETCENFLQRADEIKLEGGLGEGDLLNLELFRAELNTFIQGYKFKGFHFPLNYMEGVHIDFQRLTEWAAPKDLSDLTAIVARYQQFPRYVAELVATMQAGLHENRVNHSVSMAGVAERCRSHATAQPQLTEFFKPFLGLLEEGEEGKVREEAAAAVGECVQPGFLTLAQFLETEYLPACRSHPAVSSMPGGKEFYSACLAFHTSTDLTPEKVHSLGLQEVERIEGEMKEIIHEMGLELSLSEFTEKMRDDPTNYCGTSEELMEGFRHIIHKRILPELPALFHRLPASELELTHTPMADYPAAYYILGTEDGSRPGKFFVNTFKFSSQPKYEMVSLSLHEGLPGHHLQGCHTLEADNMPRFRKVMEDRVYSQAPSRFPINTAYVEGWGLYSETLGGELGVYSDPLDRYGHLSEEIFRACRLVVDTGIHWLDWPLDRAVQYMVDHTAASRENIVGEVNRYVTWPGQATGYKVGQLRLLELRALAQRELGDKFELKDFHQTVLNSAGPLNILEQQVQRLIAEAKQK